jgi:hypothetical protein
VLVTVEYQILPRDREPFLAALEKLGRERRPSSSFTIGQSYRLMPPMTRAGQRSQSVTMITGLGTPTCHSPHEVKCDFDPIDEEPP